MAGRIDIGAVEVQAGCLAKAGETVFTTSDAGAVQQAIDAATTGATVKIAGVCKGVSTVGGTVQTAKIAKNLTLEGGYGSNSWVTSDPVAHPTTLDAGDAGRVVHIAADAVVTLRNLTITGGKSPGSTAGGGVYNETGGSLIVEGCTITGNASPDSNTGSPDTGGVGGGISSGGALTIRTSDILNNTAPDGVGGGVYAFSDLTVVDSEVSGNSARTGGGITVNYGILTMSGSLIEGNTATWATGGAGGGGGLVVWNNAANISTTTFKSNSSAGSGGAFSHSGSGVVTVSRSTFNANTAGSASGHGGAIYRSSSSGALHVTNSTLANNTAGGNGGAIWSQAPASTLEQSTLAGNSATAGGGLYLAGALTVKGTILAGNDTGGNCAGTAPTNGGYNLDSAATCGFGTTSGSKSNTDPLLGPLADNGGPTLTFEPSVYGPAFNGGDPAYVAPAGDTDQRGLSRVIGRAD